MARSESRAVKTFVLVHHQARLNALEAVKNAPDGWMVQVKGKTRSIEQNALLWSRLEEVSKQVDWYGEKLTSEDWKHVFSASLKKHTTSRSKSVHTPTNRANKRIAIKTWAL